VVFLFQLAERFYGLPGLKDRMLKGDNNLEQITFSGFDALTNGSVDAVVTSITNAITANLPYLTLPEEIDQSNPAMAGLYATATYTNPRGQSFRGTPGLYGLTIPDAAQNPEGAQEFVNYLLSPSGRNALAKRGFLPAPVLVGGDANAVPWSLRHLIEGTYVR
ncbi:MAG: extracellular solute-binding protein, partial [Chloroflexi bacterium]|nr:extracellular solute-binding protein [Chloroflexota bacterium]